MGIERQLEAARIVDAWNELAGAPIAAVTERVWVREQVLYVRITSSTWRQELFLHRQAWRDRLNERLGKPLVAEIVFR
jgi:predicted nucleic acid-binding Zn ribbon protein